MAPRNASPRSSSTLRRTAPRSLIACSSPDVSPNGAPTWGTFRSLVTHTISRPVEQLARTRLDREDPIYWMVARTDEDREPVIRLQIVDPAVTVETLAPDCACCMHTLNGVPFVKRYDVHDP